MRDSGPLAAALLLTVLAHFQLPLPQTDPLRNTLVLLPLILVSLWSIGRWAREQGGGGTPTQVAALEAALLALLTVIALVGRQLGLGTMEVFDRLLIGGYAALLAHRVGWLIYSLRGALGPRLPHIPPAPFFALPFVVYLAILPWTTTQRPPDGDAPHYLLLTHSLAYDFDTDLANNYEQGDSLSFMGLRLEPQLGDPQGTEGQLYSRHNVVMPLVLAPFYRLAGLLGVLAGMGALTAVTCWLTLALARCYFVDLPGEAVFAWAILAFTAPFLLFSYQVWVEMPAALLVVGSLILVHRLRSEEPFLTRHWLLLFGSLLLLPLLKIRFLMIAVPLAVLAMVQRRRRSRVGAVFLLVSILVLAGGILLFNQQVFQNPLKYHDIDGLRSYTQPIGKYLLGLTGLFFDSAFGLFANAPIWMLLIPALVVVIQRRDRVLIDFAIVFSLYLVLLAPRGEWFGGWSPPYRYGVVMLPVLALWLIPLLRDRREGRRRAVIVVLLLVTVVLTILWLAVPGWTFNLAHGRSHLLDGLATRVMADVARFFPSSTRARAATIVWPVVASLTILLLWHRSRRRSLATMVGWGVAVSLLIPAALVWASQHRRTHVVEFEDPWLKKPVGSVHPDLWVVYRPRYRGGWMIPAGAALEIPAIPGGERLDLEIDLRLESGSELPGVVEITDAEGRTLDRAEIDRFDQWISISFQQLPWPEGNRLMLVYRQPGWPGVKPPHAIFDRAILDWR